MTHMSYAERRRPGGQRQSEINRAIKLLLSARRGGISAKHKLPTTLKASIARHEGKLLMGSEVINAVATRHAGHP